MIKITLPNGAVIETDSNELNVKDVCSVGVAPVSYYSSPIATGSRRGYLPDEIVSFKCLSNTNKIEAIKFLRSVLKVDLAIAKQFVENAATSLTAPYYQYLELKKSSLVNLSDAS